MITAVSVRLLWSAYQYIAVADSPGIGPVLKVKYQDLFSYSERTSHRLWDAIASMPLICLFGIFILLCTWSLLSLLAYHAAIITVAQTTNERVRGVYRYGGVVNPADEGCWHNWSRNFWCRSRPASRLPNDFSAVVQANDRVRWERPWADHAAVAAAAAAQAAVASVANLNNDVTLTQTGTTTTTFTTTTTSAPNPPPPPGIDGVQSPSSPSNGI